MAPAFSSARPWGWLVLAGTVLAATSATLWLFGQGGGSSSPASSAMPNPVPVAPDGMPSLEAPAGLALATFGGGCFWCTEAVYARLPGVRSVGAGYAGGHQPRPTYKEVITGRTGHAEVIQILYDPAVLSYRQLLEVFWLAHDPTTLNRQGADVGTQYRSIVLYRTEEERQQAMASRTEAQAKFRDPIVTEIMPLDQFWPAENYHQDYYEANQNAPYCAYVITPKLQKLEQKGIIGAPATPSAPQP